MKDIGLLMDGVYAAYGLALGNGPFHPIFGDGGPTTFCNEAVNVVCRRVGYEKFDRSNPSRPYGALLANQMFDAMNDPDGDWRPLPHGQAAQQAANAGNLVIAGYKNSDGHGHVAVVIPGYVERSAAWGDLAPKIMNVGKDVWIGRIASFAFSKAELPTFFTLKDGVLP